jgi:chitin disaccharide deacetylase
MGSAWRQRDYDFFTSDQFREILAQRKIKLITWRKLARAAEAK